MTLHFQKATKDSCYLRLALCGGPGAGKTWTSLALATGLGHPIALIDTERGSARKYANDFNFDVCELETFHPQNYIDAMIAAHQAGYTVLVVDSLSHAWAGKDGALELVDRARASGKDNPFTAWRHVTPLQHQLIDTMLGLPMHVIVTMRTKVAYVIEADERGKQVPRKVGMAPIQREGCEYEFDVLGELHQYVLTITKSRLRFLQGLILEPHGQDAIRAGRELGAQIAADLGGEGEKSDPSAEKAASSRPIDPQPLKQLWSRVTQHGVDHEAFRTYIAQLGLQSTKQLTADQLEQCLKEIDTWQGQAFEPHDNTDAEAATQAQRTRAHLFETLTALQAEISELERAHDPQQPHDPALVELAQWLTKAAQVGSDPGAPDAQLATLLSQATQALEGLRQRSKTDAAA